MTDEGSTVFWQCAETQGRKGSRRQSLASRYGVLLPKVNDIRGVNVDESRCRSPRHRQ